MQQDVAIALLQIYYFFYFHFEKNRPLCGNKNLTALRDSKINGHKVKWSIPDTADTKTVILIEIIPVHIRVIVVQVPIPSLDA